MILRLRFSTTLRPFCCTQGGARDWESGLRFGSGPHGGWRSLLLFDVSCLLLLMHSSFLNALTDLWFLCDIVGTRAIHAASYDSPSSTT